MTDAAFVLLHVSTLLIFAIIFFISRMRSKKAIHYISLSLGITIFIWTGSLLAEYYARVLFHFSGMFFVNLCFSSAAFVSVLIFFLGEAFQATFSMNWLNKLLLSLPFINAIFIWTNPLHHLFFVHYSTNSDELLRGPVAMVQAILAYVLIAIGLYLLISFSLRNTGVLSQQSLLLFIGSIVPIIVDLSYVLHIFRFPLYFEPISFSFGVVCFMVAIFKYDFLNIIPLALQTIVDHISDSYLVINESYEIVEYNRTLTDHFGPFMNIRRRMKLSTCIDVIRDLSRTSEDDFERLLERSIYEHASFHVDKHFHWQGFDKTFTIEITPIFFKTRHMGTIILLKDITEQTKAFDIVRQTQAQLIEREHLVSLGHLVAGIAHNLKTPIMSISGARIAIDDLISEYEESIDNPLVTPSDHKEIAREMREYCDKIQTYCAYMSDIISTVKGQAVSFTATTMDHFLLSELLKRIDILMNHELCKLGCELAINCEEDANTIISGEINSLVQVINNLIANSIEAYEGATGKIRLHVWIEDRLIHFSVSDDGCGIPYDVQIRLFKEMITTKGKNGTGLGLYMSYSTIVGNFKGKMYFESSPGKGSTFHIAVPFIASQISGGSKSET